MEKKLYDKKQQQLLDTFFKEFFTWSASNVGMWIAAGILIFMHSIFMVIPYQSMKDFDSNSLYTVCILGYLWYLLPYSQFTEQKKNQSVYEKIKYLPISLKQFRIFRLRKLLRFCLQLLAVFMVGQLFFSFVVYHEITLANIYYPLVWGFAFPFGLVAILSYFSK